MTRILVQRGSGSSSSNQNRSSQPSSSTAPPQSSANPPEVNDAVKDEDALEEVHEPHSSEDVSPVIFDQSGNASDENSVGEKVCTDGLGQVDLVRGVSGLSIREQIHTRVIVGVLMLNKVVQTLRNPRLLRFHLLDLCRQAPPVLVGLDHLEGLLVGLPYLGLLRLGQGHLGRDLTAKVKVTIVLTRGALVLHPLIMILRERQFEIDIRRSRGLEVERMLEGGNCLFRAVADQVYGDPEEYDLTRQMCIDYMERECDHFSQFITEGFTSYCKRKRRDKVYGNNVEIQAFCEMYNRPIHIYSYSPESINIFHGNYGTDLPHIRLSYHHGNHYSSLVDPCRLTIGAGLGFGSLHGRNADKDQVKAAMKAQQEQQIDNALVAEGRFYSNLELTEKEIERMVMEASRTEYLANTDKFKQQVCFHESSTSGAEPSSSGARRSVSDSDGIQLPAGLRSLQHIRGRCRLHGLLTL